VASILGMILWGYGYFATGTPSFIAWGEHLPAWTVEWLPNLECEIGLVLVVLGSIPLYWDMLRAG
jgi:hypothetical protein